MSVLGVVFAVLLRIIAVDNFEFLLAVIGVAVAPIGGLITLWVSTSNRIKVLEVQMQSLMLEYTKLSNIGEKLARVDTNLEILVKSMEKLGPKLESIQQRLTRAETLAENHD